MLSPVPSPCSSWRQLSLKYIVLKCTKYRFQIFWDCGSRPHLYPRSLYSFQSTSHPIICPPTSPPPPLPHPFLSITKCKPIKIQETTMTKLNVPWFSICCNVCARQIFVHNPPLKMQNHLQLETWRLKLLLILKETFYCIFSIVHCAMWINKGEGEWGAGEVIAHFALWEGGNPI